ncbi:hypothetical protein ig2599ANME_0327 [groundwater metagenome]
MKAPRVTPLEDVYTSTGAPVDVAHTYGSRHTWISLRDMPTGIRGCRVENPQGFGMINADLITLISYLYSCGAS